MSTEAQGTLLERSGQLWKLKLQTGITIAAGLPWLASHYHLVSVRPTTQSWLQAGVVLAGAVWAWAFFSIRCPSCGLHL